MIEIDKLTRFTIGNMRSLFRNAKEAKRKIEALPEEQRKKFTPQRLEEVLRGKAKREGVDYTIIAETDAALQITAFRFEWVYDGKDRIQRVTLQYEPSNLGLNPLPYFVCPYTGRLCRKLFTDGKTIISRWGFRHTYSKRNHSKKWREADKILSSLEEPERKYGKVHYREKLTPYGEKLLHHYDNQKLPSEIDEFFRPKRKGRPLKSSETPVKPSLFLE